MNPLFRIDFSISDSLKIVRKSVLIYETIIKRPGMISYEPLWQTMKRHGATTYTLQAKAGISSSTIRRMQANESVSTNTLDTLCKFFNCELDDIVKFQPDEE